MRTNAWYNFRYWWWDLNSWLCHYKILQCSACRKSRKYDEKEQ